MTMQKPNLRQFDNFSHLLTRRRRRATWGTRLAVRSLMTAGVALVAAIAVKSTALPAILREMEPGQGRLGIAGLDLQTLSDWLVLIPVPAIGLAIAALILRPLRPVLAILATLASAGAFAAIVLTLVLALAPMYRPVAF